MPASLRSRLGELASSFANDVLHAIRSASIEDLLGESTGASRRASVGRASGAPSAAPSHTPARAGAGRRSRRLRRRSAKDIAGVIESIVGLLRQAPRGLRAEQIRQKLGLQSKELPRPLKEAVEAGRLGRSGQKRATTYFVKGGPAAHKPGGAAPARKSRRNARSPKKTAPTKRAAKKAARRK